MAARTIAVVFDANATEEWASAIRARPLVQREGFNVVPCRSADDLARARPEVIVGHEHDWLARYAAANPPGLTWIHIMSAGVDGLLATLGPAPRPFGLSNARGIHATAMREYVWAAMLYFAKRIPDLAHQQRARRWARFPLPLVRGRHLLVLGTGAIGRAVAETGAALGLSLTGLSRSGTAVAPFGRVVTRDHLLEALPVADFIVLALPLTPGTTHILGAPEFGAMKPGAILVNVSRGALIEESALLAALRAGTLGGAALDAFASEPLDSASPLWDAPGLLISPHVAGKFDGGHQLGLAVFDDNLAAYLAGRPLVTPVLPERGY